MHQSVLVHADVDKGAESGDVGDDAGQHHSLAHILDAGDVLVELEDLELRAGVQSRFLKLLHDVLKRGQSAVGGHELVEPDARPQLLVPHQRLHVGADALRHLLHQGVALGVDGTAVEWII